jgi:CHASE3 domain sensor protein
VTLRARIWLLLLVAVILVLVAAVALRSGYTTVATTTSDVTSRLQPAAQGVSSLNTALAEMDSAVTAYALTEDVVDLSSYVEGTARADAEFARLKTLFEGQPQLTRLLGDTRDAYRTWKQSGHAADHRSHAGR